MILLDRRYMVKQYVTKIQGGRGIFRVFETGDPKWYLFSMVDQYDCDTGIHIPILKTDLRRDVRHALRHGRGNCV